MHTFNDICEYCPNEKPKICTGGLIPNNFKTVLKNIPRDKRIGISLSGGVDSMISSWILKQYTIMSLLFILTTITDDHRQKKPNL